MLIAMQFVQFPFPSAIKQDLSQNIAISLHFPTVYKQVNNNKEFP